MADKLVLSNLGHTWILDLDGTVVKHNGYKLDGKDTLLPGAKEFLQSIPDDDMVIFVTSRCKDLSSMTEDFLKNNDISYHYIIYDAPYGERILINDNKPSGLKMSYAVSYCRDKFPDMEIDIDDEL